MNIFGRQLNVGQPLVDKLLAAKCWAATRTFGCLQYFHKADKSMCGSSDPRVYAKFQVCSRVDFRIAALLLPSWFVSL